MEENREAKLSSDLLDRKINIRDITIKQLKKNMAVKTSKTQRFIKHIQRENEDQIIKLETAYINLEKDFLQLQHKFEER